MLHLNDEELLADEGFINYCLGRNETDVKKWNKLILDNPADAVRLDELRTLVLLTSQGIQNIELKNQITELGRRIDLSEGEAVAITGSVYKRRSIGWTLMTAAACVVLIIGTTIFYRSQNRTVPADSPLSYITRLAEKKSLVLPDGSKVILNAGSHISLAPDFGQTDRKILLDGEAYFDVAHDTTKPFIVQTSSMDVKVLGTAFNVKAYATDATYETSLIRGSIQLSLKKEHKTILLHPNEKYVLKEETKNISAATVNTSGITPKSTQLPEGLVPVKIDKKDTSIVEVSWTENKLAFADEPLDEVAKKLERWYGVKIEITDAGIAKNAYTASFRNEDIMNVLAALQFSRPFTFKKENDEIIISK
ncbi:MAG: DUF4974 domain-containing protein [Chitinophagaceae bacterium]|nr:DUF4974 domain-containing protein [Chitinophagaceae bacterium]